MTALHRIWQDLLEDLEMQKARIVNEIRAYPPPIPACDAQFNYLLEKRDRLTVDLNHLQQLNEHALTDGLMRYAEESSLIADSHKQAIMGLADEGFATGEDVRQ